MKVIVAGSRDFNNYALLNYKLSTILSNQIDVEIVSGTANGADWLGEKYAEANNLKLTLFPADWDKYGKRAGYLRNKQMAEYADALVCFWDGKSKGSKLMIELATELGLKVRVVRYGKQP